MALKNFIQAESYSRVENVSIDKMGNVSFNFVTYDKDPNAELAEGEQPASVLSNTNFSVQKQEVFDTHFSVEKQDELGNNVFKSCYLYLKTLAQFNILEDC